MTDKAHIETDKRLEKLESDLAKYYASVGKDLNAMQAKALKSYYSQLADYKQRLDNGDIDEDEYRAWLLQQSTSPYVKKTAEKLTDHTVKADIHASNVINGVLAGIYVINQQQTFKQAQSRLKSSLNVSVSSTFHTSAEDIKNEYDRKANEKVKGWKQFKSFIDKVKDGKWTEEHYEAAMRYGIQQGYSNQRMEKAIQQALGENYNSCVRLARTYTTGIENLARLEAARKLVAEGWELEKEWLSAHDKRVRDSHKFQDRENKPIEEPFRNGLMYPGDRSTNDPGEFINCRCRMNINVLGSPK